MNRCVTSVKKLSHCRHLHSKCARVPTICHLGNVTSPSSQLREIWSCTSGIYLICGVVETPSLYTKFAYPIEIRICGQMILLNCVGKLIFLFIPAIQWLPGRLLLYISSLSSWCSLSSNMYGKWEEVSMYLRWRTKRRSMWECGQKLCVLCKLLKPDSRSARHLRTRQYTIPSFLSSCHFLIIPSHPCLFIFGGKPTSF